MFLANEKLQFIYLVVKELNLIAVRHHGYFCEECTARSVCTCMSAKLHPMPINQLEFIYMYNNCDPSREKGPYGNCEKYQPWSACAVRAG